LLQPPQVEHIDIFAQNMVRRFNLRRSKKQRGGPTQTLDIITCGGPAAVSAVNPPRPPRRQGRASPGGYAPQRQRKTTTRRLTQQPWAEPQAGPSSIRGRPQLTPKHNHRWRHRAGGGTCRPVLLVAQPPFLFHPLNSSRRCHSCRCCTGLAARDAAFHHCLELVAAQDREWSYCRLGPGIFDLETRRRKKLRCYPRSLSI
jgi:hypothetical protein